MPIFFHSAIKCHFYLVSAIILLLTACGGGDGGDSSVDIVPNSPVRLFLTPIGDSEVSRNLALLIDGASAVSTFSGNEYFMIDGDLSVENYWSPSVEEDSVTIELLQLSTIGNIILYTNYPGFLSVAKISVSNDGRIFRGIKGRTNDVGCDVQTEIRMPNSAVELYCDLRDVEAKYIKLTVLENPEEIEIYEFEIRDKSKLVNFTQLGGATVSPVLDGNESVVIDGDFSNNNSWVPSVDGESVTVGFGQQSILRSVNVSFSGELVFDDMNFRMSNDGINFEDITCINRTIRQSTFYSCNIPNQNAKYVMIDVQEGTEVNIHEVAIRGVLVSSP